MEKQTNQFQINDLDKSAQELGLGGNLAPEKDDVWDHKKLLNVVSHTPDEVNLLKEFQANGVWVDIFRKHNPKGKHFSWWSYRSKDWKLSNRGRRLDHIWVTEDFKKSLNCYMFGCIHVNISLPSIEMKSKTNNVVLFII